MSKLIQLLLLCAVPIGSGQALAQDSNQVDQANQGLSLFEDIEVAENRARGASRTSREPRVTGAGPEFTLLGTSRIGDSYSAILRHKSGESILVRSQANTATAIEDHAGYSILGVGPGKLSLRYPASVPCEEYVEQGVSCAVSSNTAELVLATSTPLSRPALERQSRQTDSANSSKPPVALVANPFEALRAAQVDGDNPAQNNDGADNRFSPRRISPDDVPSGMRVVSTPFGDRLVDQ
jgi:hypothetical protein